MANAQSTALIAALNGSGANMVLRAAKAPIAEDVLIPVLADIMECDFAGYVPRPLTDFGGVDKDTDNVGEALTEMCSFAAADPLPAPQSIFFLYITQTQPGQPEVLRQIVEFPDPYPINTPNQTLNVQVRAMGFGFP